MYKISDSIINFITNARKNRKLEFLVRRQTLVEIKIRRIKYKGVSQSPLPFVVAMMPLNYIHWKYTGATNLQNHKNSLITLCTFILKRCLQENMKRNKRLLYKEYEYTAGIW